MLNHDRAAKKAEELWLQTRSSDSSYGISLIAAELRVLYDKLNQKDDEYEQQCKHAEAEIARLRAELAKVKP